jgi:trehalose-6-phosphate synthase
MSKTQIRIVVVKRGPGQSSGGVATAMRSKLKPRHTAGGKTIDTVILSISANDIVCHRMNAEGEIVQDAKPVATLDPEIVKKGDGFANRTYWQWAHRQDREYGPRQALGEWNPDFGAYINWDRCMTDAVVLTALGYDEVLVEFHDYHWFRCPRQLRKRLPHARIGLVLYTSYGDNLASPMMYYLDRMAMGGLGADVICFQTDDWRQSFLSHAATRFSTHWVVEMSGENPVVRHLADGHRVRLIVQPIMVDPDRFAELGRTQPDPSLYIPGRKLITTYGRLDHSKGYLQLLQSGKIFFERFPHRKNEVTFQLIAEETRPDCAEHREDNPFARYLEETQAAAAELYRMGEACGQPLLDWRKKAYRQDQLGPICAMAEVNCAPSLLDGFCMGPVESACNVQLSGSHFPVIAISRGCGCHRYLHSGGKGCITVDPHDVEGMAYVLERALCMPMQERRERIEFIQDAVRAQPIQKWAERMFIELEDLQAAA